MANEITATGTIAFAKGNVASIGRSKSSSQFTVTGSKYVLAVQNIGTVAEAIGLGDLGTPGWYFIYNMDATNYVELLDAAAGNVFGKLKAGEWTIGRFGCVAPAAKANSSALNIEYMIVED